MLKKSLLTALATAFLALPLSAQETETTTADVLEQAMAAGIPVSLLESKIAEGQAKGVPMDVIQEAVARRAEALIHASTVLQAAGIESPEPADLSVGADALQGGVSEAVLLAIAETAPVERRAVAIAALTQLVGVGIVPEEALSRVEDALQRGPGALANLPVQAGAASGVGGIPDGVPASGRPAGAGQPEGTPGGERP